MRTGGKQTLAGIPGRAVQGHRSRSLLESPLENTKHVRSERAGAPPRQRRLPVLRSTVGATQLAVNRTIFRTSLVPPLPPRLTVQQTRSAIHLSSRCSITLEFTAVAAHRPSARSALAPTQRLPAPDAHLAPMTPELRRRRPSCRVRRLLTSHTGRRPVSGFKGRSMTSPAGGRPISGCLVSSRFVPAAHWGWERDEVLSAP